MDLDDLMTAAWVDHARRLWTGAPNLFRLIDPRWAFPVVRRRLLSVHAESGR